VTFVAFMREALKKTPKAEVAFVTTRLAVVRTALDRIEINIGGVKHDTETLLKGQEEIMDNQQQLARLVVDAVRPAAGALRSAEAAGRPLLRNFIPAVLDEQSWVGREQLVQMLTTLQVGACRILALVGLTGIGKTALTERVLGELARRSDFEDRPVHRHIFDRDEAQPASFVKIAADWLEQANYRLTNEIRNDEQSLLQFLIKYATSSRAIFVLDAIERILEAHSSENLPSNRFRDRSWLEFCRALLTHDSADCRLFLTSQDNSTDLEQLATEYSARWYCQVVHGLDAGEQIRLFSALGLCPTSSLSEDILRRIGAAYDGHPLALKTIAGEIKVQFTGDIQGFWVDHGQEFEEVENALASARRQAEATPSGSSWQLLPTRQMQRHVKRRLVLCFDRLHEAAPEAHLLLCAISEYDGPISKDRAFEALELFEVPLEKRNPALEMLSERYLIELVPDRSGKPLIALHNLVHSVALERFHTLYNNA